VVENTGWGMLADALVSDTLPTGLAMAGPVTLEPPEAGTVLLPPPYLVHGLTIAPGEAVTVTFPVQALDGLARITNTAAVTSAEIHVPMTGMVVVTVTNLAPIAVDDGYEVTEDGALVVTASLGVLANDEDVPADVLTAALAYDPLHGVVTLTASGEFTYVPEANFFGADAFIYTVFDGDDSVTATVNITVTGVNDPPDVTNPGPQINTVGDTVSLPVEAGDVDGDFLTYSAIGLPPGLSISSTMGLISGTLGGDSAGSYTVTVEVSDGALTAGVTFRWAVSEGLHYLPRVARNYVSALHAGAVGDGFRRGRPRWSGPVP
jgi:VCBS repeat-containing protein